MRSKARPVKGWRLRAVVIALLALALAAGAWILARRRAAALPLCGHAAELFCQKLEACGGVAPEQIPACVARHANDCELDLGWRLRRGVLRFEQEAEDECFEGLESAGCGAVISVLGDDDQDILELTDRCELDELQPNSSLGEPCALPGDCKAGTCPYAEPGCHVCRAFAPVGHACSLGMDACEPRTSYCAHDNTGGHCAKRKQDGSSCQGAEECVSPVCHATATGSRQCAREVEGDSCQDGSDCASHSFCRRGPGGSRCERRAATGAACVASGDESVCEDGEARCVHGRCRVRPFSEPAGAACLDLTDCQSGLYCRGPGASGQPGICTRQARAGEPCPQTDLGACELNSRCVGSTCKALARRGEPCGGPYECTAELECIPKLPDLGFAGGASCLAPAENGETCGRYRSCRDGFCSPRGSGAVCISKNGSGAPCQSREECVSGRCQPDQPGGPARCQGPCGSL